MIKNRYRPRRQYEGNRSAKRYPTWWISKSLHLHFVDQLIDPEACALWSLHHIRELELLASAGQQMARLLAKLAEGTETSELQRAFKQQFDCSEQHWTVIELMKETGRKARIPRGSDMKTLIEECLVLHKGLPSGNLRDAVTIAHIQRAQHYKMAAYTSVRDYAKLLGLREAAIKLEEALRVDTSASKALGSIAIQVDAEAYVDTREEGT